MSKKNNALPEDVQARLIEILNRRLADAIDLQLQCRQAYWNVKGPNFLSLRGLFDKVVEEVEEYANLIAGRIVQLGGKAEGTACTVSERSSLDGHLLASAGHINTLATTLTDFGRHTRYASTQATELKDADTADIFTEIARGIDKWLWFVQTSQRSGNGVENFIEYLYNAFYNAPYVPLRIQCMAFPPPRPNEPGRVKSDGR